MANVSCVKKPKQNKTRASSLIHRVSWDIGSHWDTGSHQDTCCPSAGRACEEEKTWAQVA